jgi:hypothetical protein
MSEQAIESIPARIIQRVLSTEQLTAMIQADMGDIEPFFWPAEISNNNLDFYFGRMAESTLKNFANDASAGVSFLDSHNSRNLGYGQSLIGSFEQTGEMMRTVVDFYTVPGIKFSNGVTYASTDDFIRAVNTRLTRDVSVGVYGGERICDICGEDIYAFDWETWRYACPHVPGVVYPVGERGEETILATFMWENGRLAEVSSVYDGATPGAAIGKAQRMIDAGAVPAALMNQLEVKYHIKAPDKQWSGFNKQERGKTMVDEAKLREFLTSAAVENPNQIEDGVRLLIEQRDLATLESTKLKERVNELTPLADDGKSYRTDLVAEALAEGVRAFGDEFPQETYEEMLKDAPIAHVKKVRDTFAREADKRFPGGRVTGNEDEKTNDESAPVNTSVPDKAFA